MSNPSDKNLKQDDLAESKASHEKLLEEYRQKGYRIEDLPPLSEDDPLYAAFHNKRRTGKFEFAEELVDNLNKNVIKDSEWWEKNKFEIQEKNLEALKKHNQQSLTSKFAWVIIVSMILIVLISFFSGSAQSQILNFNNSPNNWTNSPNNWDNSPNNFNNSPNNFNNSPNNFSATNGVYDNRGNRIGYEVQAPSGVINYFDNSGNRIGYKPTGK